MVTFDDKERARFVFTHISRCYTSAISLSLSLIVAWLAFIYASKRLTIDQSLLFVIGAVLVALGVFAWIRVVNFKKVLDELETKFNIDDFRSREEITSYSIIEWAFKEKRFRGVSLGIIVGSFLLVVFYVVTICVFYIVTT